VGSTVTNTGLSVISGDIGLSPGSSITGFPPGVVTAGSTIHIDDAVAVQAKTDLTAAYNTLIALPCQTDLTGTDLGGLTLTPGKYCFSSSAQLTGSLILDGQGNPSSLFVFQMGSTLTTASNSAVLLLNNAMSCNIFWLMGSSATLGTSTSFVGNLLATASITLTTGVSIENGRALAMIGAVTLDTNTITVPSGSSC